MGITMAEIAKRLGVSKSTVSRALSGDPRVKEETRRRIVELAGRLNYHPHPVASGLARRRTHTFGLAIPSPPRSFSNPFYLEFIGGVGDYAMGHGYTLFFVRPEELLSDGSGTAGAITASADGFILTEPELDDPRIEHLRSRGKPFVFLGRTLVHTESDEAAGPDQRTEWERPEESGFDEIVWVDGDNVGGARQVVSHLIELGHRHIACVTGPKGQVSTYMRLEGYRRALREAGIRVPDRAVAAGDYTEDGGREATQRLLETYPEMTAVFASNDLMACGAIQELRRAGKSVPKDVSVAGFDGIRLGRLVTPELTTAIQPIYRLGEVAAELLLAQILGKPLRQRHIVLPCTLSVRASTAPPPTAQRPFAKEAN